MAFQSLSLLNPKSLRGFTLLELCIAIFIALLVISMAIPTLSGVLEGSREEISYREWDDLVQDARQRAMQERRQWLLEWQPGAVVLRPAESPEVEESFPIGKDETMRVEFPNALIENPSAQWAFWPSGGCEAAVVKWSDGRRNWTATYNPLTAQAEVVYERE